MKPSATHSQNGHVTVRRNGYPGINPAHVDENGEVYFDPSKSVTDVTQATDDKRSNRLPSSATSVASDASVSSATSVTLDIRKFLPHKPEVWRKALFKLARHTFGRQDADQLFNQWSLLVNTGLAQNDLAEEWAFCKSNVKQAPRIDLAQVLARSQFNGIQEWMVKAVPESTRFQAVLAFLWELAQAAFPQENFFISTRDLGMLFDKDATWASRTLMHFCKQCIIEVVDRGGPHNQKATRYRFCWKGARDE